MDPGAPGELEIGTEAKPYTHNATITLTNNVPGEDIETMGDRGIMMMGGTLSLHGAEKNSWTTGHRKENQGFSVLARLGDPRRPLLKLWGTDSVRHPHS